MLQSINTCGKKYLLNTVTCTISRSRLRRWRYVRDLWSSVVFNESQVKVRLKRNGLFGSRLMLTYDKNLFSDLCFTAFFVYFKIVQTQNRTPNKTQKTSVAEPGNELGGGGGVSWFTCPAALFPFRHFFFFLPKIRGGGCLDLLAPLPFFPSVISSFFYPK